VPRRRELYIQRYWREWSKRYAEVRLRLKREEYEVLRKLADSKNMTIKSFILDMINNVVSIEKERNELVKKLKSYEKDIQLVNQLNSELSKCRNSLKVYEDCCREKEKDYRECVSYLKECNNYVESCKNVEERNKELEKRLKESENRSKILSDNLKEFMDMLDSIIRRLCFYESRCYGYSTECRQWEKKFENIKDKLREELHIY